MFALTQTAALAPTRVQVRAAASLFGRCYGML